MLSGYNRGRLQCEAASQDKWQQSPHYWSRCQKWATHVRDGMNVCACHARTAVVLRYDTPEAERPHWTELRAVSRGRKPQGSTSNSGSNARGGKLPSR